MAYGGRIKRGIRTEDSLRQKVWEECRLELDNIMELGYVRMFFKTAPFEHGKGTDATSIVYFGRGKGKLKLDSLHENPTIIQPDGYLKIRDSLHPFVQDFVDITIKL